MRVETHSSMPESVLTVQGVPIRLAQASGVWQPTPNGLFYASFLEARPGERVIDIGAGSGVLAIWAALQGAAVFATDTDGPSVAAARASASLNGVAITVAHDSLFGPWRQSYDAIFANLPNEWVPPAHIATLSPTDAAQFVGGEGGNRLLIDLLEAAPLHMHAGSRLYLPVHSLTDYRSTLAKAKEHLDLELLAERELPAKEFVSAYWEFYEPLVASGVIEVRRRSSSLFTVGYVYCARLKSPPR